MGPRWTVFNRDLKGKVCHSNEAGKAAHPLLIAAATIFGTIALLVFFAVGTEAGRGTFFCRLYPVINGGEREILAKILPVSGSEKSPDRQAPSAEMQYLAVEPGLLIPLPKISGTPWTVSGTDLKRAVLEAGTSDNKIVFTREEMPAAPVGVLLPESLGGMLHTAFTSDLSKPCNPAKGFRELIAEMMMIVLKGGSGRRAIDGVVDQWEQSTTTLEKRPQEKRGVYFGFVSRGRWFALNYSLDDDALARDVVRALRAAKTPEAEKSLMAAPAGWTEAVAERHLLEQ